MENCKRILIIEDSEDERDIYVKYLGIIAKDAYIIESGSFADAMQILDSYSADQIDLVLTDFELTDGNSREIVTTLKVNEVPVILMSKGSSDPDFAVACEDADVFIEKPLEFPKLKALVREMLGIE